MKQPKIYFLAALFSVSTVANGQVVIADNYNVVGSGTGFNAASGVNTGIGTRLTGSAASALTYINIGPKGGGNYSITGDRVRAAGNNANGAFTLSSDRLSSFNFASSLGSTTATPLNPVIYDIALTMANNLGGGPRFSFGLQTETPVDGVGTAGIWDFGVQLDRANASTSPTETAYDVIGRIDSASRSVAGDANFTLQTLGANTYGTEVNVMLRVTDAGMETTGFNSRVQVSLDGGNSFIYNTDSDGGFRFDGADRFFIWDLAGNGANGGEGFYDNFSVSIFPVPEPSTFALAGLGGVALLWLNRKRGAKS